MTEQNRNQKKRLNSNFKLNTPLKAFLLNPPRNLSEEGKSLLAVTTFEATNFVSTITIENKSFSITIPGHWNSELAEKTIDELFELLEFRSQNDIDLHVERVFKKMLLKNFCLSNRDTFKSERLEKVKKGKLQ